MSVTATDDPIFHLDSNPFGVTYGQWTIRWWNWALSTPVEVNPVLDCSGQYANVNQSGPVWFLAGTVGDKNKIADRTCSIPLGKAILFPVINYICTYNKSEPIFFDNNDLIRRAGKDIDDIVIRNADLDCKPIKVYRVFSDPYIFQLNVMGENILGIPQGTSKAAADGYWVFLKPMTDGAHTIRFHGSCSGGTRNAAANYQIKVM
ncbi:MAG TPA: hypothetical protein VH500_21945 [Nitrososphaeraceae archaeon]|jgi:hypothetical protein